MADDAQYQRALALPAPAAAGGPDDAFVRAKYERDVKRDPAGAVAWFEAAAAGGHAEAMYALGRHFGPSDPVGIGWLEQAVAAGHPHAQGVLDQPAEVARLQAERAAAAAEAARRADDLPWGQLAKAVGIAFVGFNAVFLELASYVWPYVSSWAAWRALRDQAGPWKVLFADFYYGDIVGWWTLAAALSVALSAGAAAAVGYGLVWRKVRAAR